MDAAAFCTTRWSVVVAAGASANPESDQALETLCRTYWYPLYAYIRRAGRNPEDSKDLTQSFLTHLLEKETFRFADRDRGRFRTFLLSALKYYLVDQNRRNFALKRGGGHVFESLESDDPEQRYRFEPPDDETPDRIYDRGWAKALLRQAIARLRQEYAGTKHGLGFEALKDYIWGNRSGTSCADLGRELGISEEAAKKSVQRLRHRFAELLREQIAETVTSPAELEDELRYLASLLR